MEYTSLPRARHKRLQAPHEGRHVSCKLDSLLMSLLSVAVATHAMLGSELKATVRCLILLLEVNDNCILMNKHVSTASTTLSTRFTWQTALGFWLYHNAFGLDAAISLL